MTKKEKRVGVLLDLDCELGRRQLTGIFRHANICRWHLHVFNSLDEAIAGVGKAGVDGLILGVHPTDGQAASLLGPTSFKLVTLGQYVNALSYRKDGLFSTVAEEEVGRRGAAYLASLGNFSAFGIVNDMKCSWRGPCQPKTWADRRVEGFVSALAKKDISASVYNSDYSCGEREENLACIEWLRSLPLPAAVMGVCDETAARVLAACRSAEISVPADMVVLGVDNDRVWCESARPRLSSLQVGGGHEGLWAAASLDRLMDGKPVRGNSVLGVIDVVERESTRYLSSSLSVANAAMGYIRKHACSGIRPRDVVDYLNISRSLADMRFREIFGGSIGEAIEETRLKRVKELLKATSWPVKRIASVCGYSSANRLTHVFGQRMGMTMREWRDRNQ